MQCIELMHTTALLGGRHNNNYYREANWLFPLLELVHNYYCLCCAVVIPFGPLFSFVACMALLVHMIGSVQ